ncbi:MAG: hypothetical protein U0270_31395 [Labilithrix sp.]
MRIVTWVSSFSLVAACTRAAAELPAPADASVAPPPPAVPAPPAPPEPVSVDALDVPGDLEAYVLRGVRQRSRPMVFLGGMCVHPQGYLMSFAHAAVEHGVAIALQGDVSCGGGQSRWSYDVERTNRRIDAAFAAAGEPAPVDAIAIGLSQGADLAEKLAARWPEKYTRVILIASPLDPKPRAAKSVLMAGNYDVSKERMRRAAVRLGPSATFISLGDAYHGQLGPAPNGRMAAALDFVDAPR